SGLIETNDRIHGLRWPGRIKAIVVGGSPTQCIRVLILGNCRRIPAYEVRILIKRPGRVAVSGVAIRSIRWEARVIRWRVEPDVCDINSAAQWHHERLNPAIEVLVVDRILVVVDA